MFYVYVPIQLWMKPHKIIFMMETDDISLVLLVARSKQGCIWC